MPPRKTTTQRGLGWRHQRDRERLLRNHVDGTPCWWCGEPMHRTQALDADHSNPRDKGGTKADRLLHAPCNRARGNGDRDHLRPALTGTPTERDDRAQWLLLPW
ncbi:hypothetical protein GYA93_15860 [Gordonia desulfuricans]|uniref:HNH endonuclease n=2 Tax=Gordonia desulfuricans TaxID=89051 RepID=A0A7K3LTZ7_9ACTN|nr:hypothetical protein [Gordonia desulfuricans]